MVARYRAPAEFERARQQVKEIVFCDEAAAFYSQSLQASINQAIASLEENKPHEFAAIRALKRMTGKRLYNIMRKAVTETADEECVMCHGDLWVNNIMFSYDADGFVESVKLVDLQTMRLASPAIDLLHFFYTSLDADMRHRNTDLLLDIYIETLRRDLSELVTEPKHLKMLLSRYTVENVRRQCRAKMLYGFGMCMWLMPAITFHADMIPNLNDVTLADFQDDTQQKVMMKMQTPEYHTRISETILEFLNAGLLDEFLTDKKEDKKDQDEEDDEKNDDDKKK